MRILEPLVLACALASAHAASLLAIFPVPGRSHWMLERRYLEQLAARGHQVTVITPYKSDSAPSNWREVIVPDVKHLLGGSANLFDFSLRSPVIGLFFLFQYGINACDVLLKEESVQQLYKSEETFDAVIVESFFQECFLAFAHKFKGHLIHVAPYEGTHWVGDTVGNPNPFAYVPDPFLRYTDHMDFCERLYNSLFGTFQRIIRQVYFLPRLDAIVQKHFNDATISSVATIEREAALLLVHTHVTVGHPRPAVPNRIAVGGMHIFPPKKLPQDLQKYLDEAKEGVIYFSLGSNLNSTDMPSEKRAAFITVFSRLKQRVLWKWEADSLPNQPPNVMVRKWLPQSDILAHRNIKLFITHGGLLSTLEAVDRGVPLLAIPVYGDQMLNAIRAEKAGYAKKIEFPSVSTESLWAAVSEMLTNSSYRDRAQKLSRLFHDRPRPALEEAIYWTEYVIRHNGALHLRSAAMDLTWYQYLLLDVIAMLLAVGFVALLTAVFIIRAVVRLFAGRKSHGGQKKKRSKKD
ncbi:UDP-glycosyltransferase UGT5-like [Schistocerca gregaria]|uniref:UDP-glycosyltransferase UGT5-like n=1 Tax=Schistocerca gregaria TaxID=7010 RepID=UPI00211DB855|nr:UDP-glycosyltransferase UGT5-like [Schistocerca gregaria]